MKRRLYLLLLLLLCTPAAHAALKVFACEPEWAALVRELAGDEATLYTATTARQDPHRIEARPSLIAQARRADLVVCTGAELEQAWLPMVLREAGNAQVLPGAPGYFEAADHVALLEVPTRLDRAEGDLHARGNPHLHLDARNFLPIAAALMQKMGTLDPARAAHYQQRHADFAMRWRAALARWEHQAAALKGLPIVVQHKGFPYLVQWLGLQEVATLEPKPGMEPSAAHLHAVTRQLQRQPARFLLRAAYQNPRPAEWLAQNSGIRIVELPYTVGGSAAAQDLFTLFDDTLARLLAGLR